MILNDYYKLYHSAKRTAIIAYDKLTKEVYHIFSVLELLPQDIPDYNIPKKDWYSDKKHPDTFSKRSEINTNDYTFSLIIQNILVEEAITAFENPLGKNNYDGTTNKFFNKSFFKEPSGDSPIVLKSNQHEARDLGSILPKRQSGSFVWTQIDSEREVERLIIRNRISDNMKALSQLSNDFLGFNIIEKAEHLGNIYLTAPNPYYRDLDISLSTNPSGIFYHFKMRKGIKERLKVRIIDKHGDNIALDKVYPLNSYIGLLPLPHEPHLVELRIYNSKNDLISMKGPSSFLKSIQFGMSIKQADLHVNVDTEKGKKDFTVEKYSKEIPTTIGRPINFNAAYYFKNAETKKKTNKESNDFIFFRGNKEDKEIEQKQAQKIIRNLINEARFRCFICDPYFGVSDLIDYAFYIKNTSVELNILNAKEHIDKEMGKKLLLAINEYNSKPFQKIKCRILRGSKSILHDRFIVADDDIWFVGTSLNQIGTKATCIGKVPKPENLEIIREIENWFFNKTLNYSKSIEEYAS